MLDCVNVLSNSEGKLNGGWNASLFLEARRGCYDELCFLIFAYFVIIHVFTFIHSTTLWQDKMDAKIFLFRKSAYLALDYTSLISSLSSYSQL